MPKKVTAEILKARARFYVGNIFTKQSHLPSDDVLKKEALSHIGDANLSPELFITECKENWKSRNASSNNTNQQFEKLEKIKQESVIQEAKILANKNFINGKQIDDDIKLKENAKIYGNLSEIFIKEYKNAIQNLKITQLKDRIISLGKIRGKQASANGSNFSEIRIKKIAAQYDNLAQLYFDTYKESFQNARQKMTEQQHILVRAKRHGQISARNGLKLQEDRLQKAAEKYGAQAKLYFDTFKESFQKECLKYTPEQRIKIKATKFGYIHAWCGNILNEGHLKRTADKNGTLTKLFYDAYKEGYNKKYQQMTLKQRTIARATNIAKRRANNCLPLNMVAVEQMAKTHKENAQLFIDTYKSIYESTGESKPFLERLINKARKLGADLSRNGYKLNEAKLKASSSKFGVHAQAYFDTYKNSYYKSKGIQAPNVCVNVEENIEIDENLLVRFGLEISDIEPDNELEVDNEEINEELDEDLEQAEELFDDELADEQEESFENNDSSAEDENEATTNRNDSDEDNKKIVESLLLLNKNVVASDTLQPKTVTPFYSLTSKQIKALAQEKRIQKEKAPMEPVNSQRTLTK